MEMSYRVREDKIMPYKLFKLTDGQGKDRVWRSVQLRDFFGRHYQMVQNFVNSSQIGEIFEYTYNEGLSISQVYTLERTQ